MRLLVIGNGFDLQHGLSTGYKDFIQYCERIDGERRNIGDEVSLMSAALGKEFLSGEFAGKEALYEEFFSLYKNFWLAHFIKHKNDSQDKWMDFEKSIELVIKDILADRERERNQGHADDSISMETCSKYRVKDLGCNSYRELLNKLANELHKFVRLFEIYLCVHVEKQIDNAGEISFFKKLNPDKVLSFNYTSTFWKLYDSYTVEMDYLHGEAKEKQGETGYQSTNIVLGFDDHYYDKSETVLESVPFEKYYQRIVNNTGIKIYDWLAQDGINEVCFYGHSMSPADGDILRALICRSYGKTIIYYRRDHEEERAMMIQNLAVVLTPEELIKRTNGANSTISFIPLTF